MKPNVSTSRTFAKRTLLVRSNVGFRTSVYEPGHGKWLPGSPRAFVWHRCCLDLVRGVKPMKRKICSILTAIGLCLLSIVPATASHYRQGASHYRVHYVTRHHHSRAAKKVMTIAAPIAIGAAFGPAGSIGYQGFKHRRFIGHHLGGHHRSYKRHVAGHHRR